MRLLVAALVGTCIVTLYADPANARSGCCSWHGGVAYCDTSVGRYVCNDGEYSPSCGCATSPSSSGYRRTNRADYAPRAVQSPDPILTAVQACLRAVGCDPGSVDGHPGPSTSKALAKFVRRLDAAGVPHSSPEETVAALATQVVALEHADPSSVAAARYLLGLLPSRTTATPQQRYAAPSAMPPTPSYAVPVQATRQPSASRVGCDPERQVKTVQDSGRVVVLDDESVWQVDPVDAVDSSLWLPLTHIVACPDSLINTEDGEAVAAQEIGPTTSATVVQQSSGVIRSRIEGDFEGWDGDTVFALENGQVWVQASYAYHYRYAYRPEATLIPTASGWLLMVDGDSTTVQVRRIR